MVMTQPAGLTNCIYKIAALLDRFRIIALSNDDPSDCIYDVSRLPQRRYDKRVGRFGVILNILENIIVMPVILLHGKWQIKKPRIALGLGDLAPRPGLEPGTCGLTVRRSTD
jgi:hypothetical protein